MRNLIFYGDSHGENDIFIKNIIKFEIKNTDIIHVGDFNVGFQSLEKQLKELGQINDFLNTKNNHLYIVRGNHDNPSWFLGNIIEYSNIDLVQDYTLLNIQGKNIFCVGGAISLNRMKLVTNKTWWHNENFLLDKEKIPSEKIDILVTHSAPDIALPFGVNSPLVSYFAENDDTLIDGIITERKELTILYESINKNDRFLSIYGHFHNSYFLEIEDSRFRGLDCHEIYEYH